MAEGLELESHRLFLRRRSEAIDESADGGGRKTGPAAEPEGIGGRQPANRGRYVAVVGNDAAMRREVAVRSISRRRNRGGGSPEGSRGRVHRQQSGRPQTGTRPKGRDRAERAAEDGIEVAAEVRRPETGTATAAAGADLGAVPGGEPAGITAVAGDGARTVPLATDAAPGGTNGERGLDGRPGQSLDHDDHLKKRAEHGRTGTTADNDDGSETASAMSRLREVSVTRSPVWVGEPEQTSKGEKGRPP